MKKLLITHTDLDGVSPIILLNLAGVKFDYKTIEISEVTTTLTSLIPNIKQYEEIYITDLSLTEQVYELIKDYNNIRVFDHHATHLFANCYPFVTVKVSQHNRLTCATEIFYEYLKPMFPLLNNPSIQEYVELVRQLDTYTFQDRQALELGNIEYFYGKEEYIKIMSRRLKKNTMHFSLTAFEKRYVKLKQKETDAYIDSKDKEMLVYQIKDKICGVVFAERNKSELGNVLAKRHPELDLIIIFDAAKSVSYRTIKDDVLVNDFAQGYGGGGHQKASGSPITTEMREKIICDYFSETIKITRDIP